MTTKTIAAFFVGALAAGSAQAALHDRGGGLIYDDVLNVTWLQDANYAKTSRYNSDGRMTWYQAVSWVGNLSYFDSVRGVTYYDWRLPKITPVNGVEFDFTFSYDGSTDQSYNIAADGSAHPGSMASELAYMYYVNLGGVSFYSVTGIGHQPGYTPRLPQDIFSNIYTGPDYMSTGYWSGTQHPTEYPNVLDFEMEFGGQGISSKTSNQFAWAVRDGDVAAVPEASTYAMFLAGLGLVGFVASRRTMAKKAL